MTLSFFMPSNATATDVETAHLLDQRHTGRILPHPFIGLDVFERNGYTISGDTVL